MAKNQIRDQKVKASKSILDELKAFDKPNPLEFLLEVMHTPHLTVGTRLEAAKAAAPYLHCKMPIGVDHAGEIDIIPPFVPSRGQLAEDYRDELPEDYFDDDL